MVGKTTLSGRHMVIATRAPLVIAVVAQIILVLAVVAIGRQGDRELRAHQRRILSTQITDAVKTERAYAVDMAFWTPLADALARQPIDRGFLSDRLALNLITYSEAQIVAVVDRSGNPVWILADGEERDRSYLDSQCPDCIAYAVSVLERADKPASGYADHAMVDSLADRAELPDSFPARAGVTTALGRPIVLAASVVAREKPAERPGVPEFAIVYTVDMDNTVVVNIGRDLGMAGVTLAAAGSTEDGIPIADEQSGKTVGLLTWPVDRPARDLLVKLAPVGLVFMLIFTALVAALSRWLRRASIDQHAGELLGNHMALHDPLTGLGNRAYLSTSLDAALATGKERPLCLLVMDLDGFKAINDTHGHGVGDDLIRQFAGRLSRCAPAGARVVRLGGDEFALLLAGHDATAAAATGSVILEMATRPFEINGIEARIGCSIGIAFVTERGQQRVDLLRRADIALYVAKAAGRNRVEFYDASMEADLDRRHAMADTLGRTLATPELFDVDLEPIYAIDGQKPVQIGVEATLRLRRPDSTFGSIADIQSAAADLGLSVDLSLLLLRLACRTAAPLGKMMLSVNVSPSDIADGRFHQGVMAVLAETGFPAQRLDLELNDGLQIAHSAPAIATLKTLRAAGVRLSLDNFGASYANVSQLRSLPIHRIKISSNLLRGLDGNENAGTILSAMVTLGGSIGLGVGAEGVESGDQLRILQDAGCIQAQGPHLAGRGMAP